MKKFLFMLLLLSNSATLIYADEFKLKQFDRVSVGAGVGLSYHKDSYLTSYGGMVDVRFNLYSENAFSFRNAIEVSGDDTTSGGSFGIKERLIFSGIKTLGNDYGYRLYGGIDIGYIAFADKDRELFAYPYIISMSGFLGFEMLFKYLSPFIEIGSGSASLVGIKDNQKYKPNDSFGYFRLGVNVYF